VIGHEILVASGSWIVAAALIYLGLPERDGQSSRFEAAPMVYPPIVLVFLAIGAAEMMAALLR
jgi:hypothetical protein